MWKPFYKSFFTGDEAINHTSNSNHWFLLIMDSSVLQKMKINSLTIIPKPLQASQGINTQHAHVGSPRYSRSKKKIKQMDGTLR